ncbi:hypothetical protein HOP54_07150 [Halomonas daqingensis]|uniref:hypothetical protein n=1 Tax=Billgrantia desiderata TaxID=52021 RepID=UPI00089E7BF9|nr:hypothetical protein [Halomonas desiderata]MCE8013896.1 hypothetical protein [Halomonas desiderata]MCE8028458.1 hypothetical protein [Halomonas desiderata]NIC38531.1 hypothetical protein [Halomonas desiderata]OUE46006.1 hypothetical protein BZY95_02805 [Halomonas desiderata SP1]SEF78706.1 hypothetical protein SAMN04487953_105230 [Halomonas desiderata]
MPHSHHKGQPWPIGFTATCLRAALYILLIAALAQGAYLEALYFPEVRFSEHGFTELAQSAVLLTASALLLYVRHGLKQLPTVTLLMFAFTFSSFIREQDYWLDTWVAEHTWKVLVTLVILPCLYWVIRERRRFVAEFHRYSNSFSFGLFAAGVLTTYVFSRLYGRAAFWQAVMEEHYVRTFKDAAEEVVELLGYALILIAVIELALLTRRWVLARPAA